MLAPACSSAIACGNSGFYSAVLDEHMIKHGTAYCVSMDRHLLTFIWLSYHCITLNKYSNQE